MGSLTVGPLALPFGMLALFSALIAGVVANKWTSRTRPVDAESLYWIVVAIGLVAARVAFVSMYPDEYLAAPLSMLDIRDGGFYAPAGIATISAVTVWFAWRDKDRRRPLVWAVGSGAAVWIVAALATLATPAPRMPLPDITLADVNGGSVALAQFAGGPVVVNLWATWCPPCRREMPVLGTAQKRHPEVQFVFANQGERADTVRGYLSEQAFQLDNVLLDTSHEFSRLLGSGALPTTLFFDAAGRLVEQRMGELSAATLTQKLQLLEPGGKAGPVSGE
ncbi:MAG: prolipoprotein diacylglyceryl transferase family protein [Novosphingobium sp.]